MKTNLAKDSMRGLVPQFVDTLGDALSRKAWQLDGKELCARARQKTGLKHFGEPSVDPALTILVTSLENEANLHPVGRLLMRIHLSEILEHRLKLAGQLRDSLHDSAEASAPSPIFITGMPRSGSTFLHELLVQDPAFRAPCVWEVMSPADAAREDRGWHDWRVRRAAWNLWWFRRLAPQADEVYPLRARTPQECVAIQSYTLLSEEFVSTCHVPTYETFLRSADLRPAYLWQKRFLQFLQRDRPVTRWVLKSPDHVHGLDALFSVFPDAFVIQTHRNPLETLRSAIQLTGVLHRLYARPRPREWLAERESHNLAWSVERFMQFRGEHPELANRFADVSYPELAADPLGVVRRIYAQFKMPLTTNAAERMQRMARGRSAYKGRRTAPTLAELGLDPMAQLKRFGEYCRRFGLSGASATGSGGQR